MMKNNIYKIIAVIAVLAVYLVEFNNKSDKTESKIDNGIVEDKIEQIVNKTSTQDTISPQSLDQIIADYNFKEVSTQTIQNHFVWAGRNETKGAFFVKVTSGDNEFAILCIPGQKNLEYFKVNNVLTVKEQGGEFHCGVNEVNPPKADLLSVSPAAMPLTNITTTTHIIDLLIFYDAQVLTNNNNNVAQIQNVIIGRITACNLSLVNSLINMQWNYVGAVQIPVYSNPTNDMNIDLQTIESFNMGGTHLTGIPKFAFDQCALYGADQAVLYVGGSRNYAGLAYTLDSGGNPYHYSVVMWSYDFSVIAHEMGHNFGCVHDRQTEINSNIKSFDGDGRYFYGHRYNGTVHGDTGDIMSYAGIRLPYYSNPNVIADSYPIGVAIDQPRAAYCAKVINDMAPTMEAYRTSVSTTTPTPPILNPISITTN